MIGNHGQKEEDVDRISVATPPTKTWGCHSSPSRLTKIATWPTTPVLKIGEVNLEWRGEVKELLCCYAPKMQCAELHE